MAQAIGLPEGDRITHAVGRVVVVLTCVRPRASYRVGVHHAGNAFLGAEIAELSQSWPTEVEARLAARRACHAFADGRTVEQALSALTAQLDTAIAGALGGGDGTGRVQAPLGRLTHAREALRTPAERIAEGELVERMRADLAGYDTDARYRAALAANT